MTTKPPTLDLATGPDGLDTIVAFFENLTPESLAGLGFVYTTEACFKDPFHAVHGVSAIRKVYAHMFEALDGPRFVVTQRVQQGPQCFLVWDFEFRFKGRPQAGLQTIHGCSHLVLAPCGRIAAHRDYWDAAEELYEKIPGLAALMRWVRRRASA